MGIDRYTKVGLRRTRWRRRTRHAVPIVFPVLSKLRRLDPRIPLTSAVIAAICANFWLGSRYPSLQGKASADPNQALSTPLGFEAHFPEPPPSDFLAHALWTALEWAITNRQGMTFGLLLAAGMLTLLPLLPRPRGGRFAGAMQGAIVGAPLGVCVNCAAPIAQGMLVSGSRLEVEYGDRTRSVNLDDPKLDEYFRSARLRLEDAPRQLQLLQLQCPPAP